MKDANQKLFCSTSTAIYTCLWANYLSISFCLKAPTKIALTRCQQTRAVLLHLGLLQIFAIFVG